MKKDNILIIISSILLIISIIYWQELFIFTKTTHGYPLWAKGLPFQIMGGHLIAFIVLIPVVIFSKPTISIIKNISITLFVSITVAIMIFILSNIVFITFNSITNALIYIIFIIFFPPTMLLLFIRVIFDAINNKKANKKNAHGKI